MLDVQGHCQNGASSEGAPPEQTVIGFDGKPVELAALVARCVRCDPDRDRLALGGSSGYTPLLIAVLHGHLNVARVLVTAGGFM
eukprot:gene2385-3695_t